MILMEQKGTITADGPFGLSVLIELVRRLSCSCVLINRRKQRASSGSVMVLCLTIQPFLSLLRSQLHQTTLPIRQTRFQRILSTGLIAGLADAHFSSHVGDLDDYQETTMAWGHEMIGRVDQALAKGGDVDFEAENQAMSDKVQEATDQLLEKVLLDASNLMTNHFSLSD